jgi:hypothetical protein
MDGNYNAENVYFSEDLVTTVPVGNITLTNGQATIGAAGKNLKQVFDMIYLKEKTNINVVKPSISINPVNIKYIEIGSSDTTQIELIYDDGEYEFGYTTESGNAGDTATTIINDKTTGSLVSKYYVDTVEQNSNAPTINSGV